jgi:amino acid transporter
LAKQCALAKGEIMGIKANTFFSKTIPITLAMGIMLSPDTLVLLGNIVGKTGWTGLVLIFASMVIFFIHAANFQNLSQNTGETDFLMTRLVYIPWTTRGLATIFLSTGILVSSGFVFNEVFLHWFPNFGFAFLLLGILLGIHLTGIPMGLKAQVIFVTLTVAGLLTLILAGILTPGSQILGTQLLGSQPPGIQATAPGIMIQDRSILFLALVLWVGFDLGALALDQNTDRPGKSKKVGPLVWTIGGTGILFLLWAMVSIQHVPLAKLASSSLPHLKTAKALLGDTGRFIMGGIIIFGTLGAVNALFLACRVNTNEMAGHGRLPQWTKNQGVVPIFLALAIGLMMAKGMAGSDKLEIWIRAIFLVWLFSYALISLIFLTRQFSLANLAASLITLTGVCFLLLSGGEIIYFSLTLGAGLIPGFVFTWKSSKQNS